MARRSLESQAIPYHELQPRHVAHATLLVDRDHLLNVLPKNATVAEMGVDEGVFTERILAVTKPAKLHLIDAWQSERYSATKALAVETKFRVLIREGLLEINRGLSTDVLKGFPDNYFDWLYIDTDHGYRVTADELRVGHRKVREGGYLCGHDYVTGNWRKGLRYGVIEAVHEFCVKENWEICFLTCETHQHRSFAIKRITG
jgi:hypothetical protein